MVPDAGTARADFPGGSSDTLYSSLQALLALPDDTRLFIGHDYGSDTRETPRWEATVAEHRPKLAWRPRNLLQEKTMAQVSTSGDRLQRPLWMLPEPARLARRIVLALEELEKGVES